MDTSEKLLSADRNKTRSLRPVPADELGDLSNLLEELAFIRDAAASMGWRT
jgi:hypothetical protein